MGNVPADDHLKHAALVAKLAPCIHVYVHADVVLRPWKHPISNGRTPGPQEGAPPSWTARDSLAGSQHAAIAGKAQIGTGVDEGCSRKNG